MLQIINTSGLFADLYPDTSVTIERNNPLFIDSVKFFEDLTYSFKMPATDNNKEFFGSGHLIEALNEVYELEVQTIFGGSPFFAGSIAYTFTEGEFNTTLKVNFGAVALKVKGVKMYDIFTNDGLLQYENYTGAYMKAVCQNPKDYPYSFFPVYNDGWDVGKSTTHFLVNAWDHAAQTFSVIASMQRGDNTANCPFWKLKHYIIKTMDYLGFICEGPWMEDPESDKIFVYTRFTPFTLSIYDSTSFLSGNLTIADFLKEIKDRFQISFSFNLFAGVVRVQSASSLLASTKSVDISDYVTNIVDIATPEKGGYNITLAPDKQDLLFKDTVNTDDNEYIPTQRMIIGDGENEIEIKSSTLKSKTIDDYSMPATKQVTYQYLSSSVPAWPTRFIRYEGMKSVSGGKVFPQATPMELTLADAEWYRFRNDSKTLQITASIPFLLLQKIDGSTKITVTSKENAYMKCIIERITFNLEDKDIEYIEATIDCHTVVSNYKTPVSIEPITSLLDEGIKFISYFEETGFSQLEMEIYYEKAKVGTATEVKVDKGTFLKSTDKFGVGGTTLYFKPTATERGSVQEVRIRSGKPKHAIIRGIKIPFIQRGDYYFSNGIIGDRGSGQSDGRPILIVF